MQSPFENVVVPLCDASDQHGRLAPASILAGWFDASIQIVCGKASSEHELQMRTAGLAGRTKPVLTMPGLPVDGLAAHAHSLAPSLLVTKATDAGMELAGASSQPVFLLAERTSRRMPLGPLVVEITGSDTDLDTLALAAVVARCLDESVRLVVAADKGAPAEGQLPSQVAAAAADAEHRLLQMGCEVGIDTLSADELHPLVLAGSTRETTAIVVAQSRIAEPGLVTSASADGVNVLVAPTPQHDVGRAAPFQTDLTKARSAPPQGATLETLDREECFVRLGQRSIARLGYVDAGWPTVVPVNYRVHEGDVFIRSLEGGKLRAAERRDTVCLELDGYDEQLRSGWSVIAHGVLEVITDAQVLAAAWNNDPDPWVAAADWQWLRLIPFSVSGREALPGAGT